MYEYKNRFLSSRKIKSRKTAEKFMHFATVVLAFFVTVYGGTFSRHRMRQKKFVQFATPVFGRFF